MPSKIVIDASVLLKLFLKDEECIQQTTNLVDDYFIHHGVLLICPGLLIYEAINALYVATRQRRISSNIVAELLDMLLSLEIEIRDGDPRKILELSLKYKITAYDAAYLALAESLDCDLWTGDRAFYNTVREESARVKWIGYYTPIS
jgi:predicted nucleic acid-binding protein